MGGRRLKKKRWLPVLAVALIGLLLPVGIVAGLLYFRWIDNDYKSIEIAVDGINDSGKESGIEITDEDISSGVETNSSTAFDDTVVEHENLETSSSVLQSYDEVERILENMTLYEKVCQMFIVTPEQLTGTGHVIAAGETTRLCLTDTPVGGIIYMQQNLQNPEQTKAMLSNVQKYATEIEGMPLFLCIDEEGGRVSRIGGEGTFGIDNVSPMAEMASGRDVHEAGQYIGTYLLNLGFNIDFAPVCDVLTNPRNQVIGNRSFGSNADVVKDYAREFSDGLHECGILSTYKHFPGHGATKDDTHKGFAYTDKTLDELLKNELIPFADAENAGADMVMVSHISVPAILGNDIPCSLSYYMVTEVLKNNLGYSGIVITDAMNMGAIVNIYSGEDAVVMAIKAGNDMILAPKDLKSAVNILVDEVEAGEISEEQIDFSVKKIISSKLRMGEIRGGIVIK